MRKILLFLVPLLIAIVIFAGVVVALSKNKEKGALQVTSVPRAEVAVDGKVIGQTPFCRCEPAEMLDTGTHTIKVVPLESGYAPYEDKITIAKSVLTVVDRNFGKGATSEGSIITLTPLENAKEIALFVTSFPDGADISLDNNLVGVTPLLLKNITPSDHEIRIKKSGYKEKIVRIRAVTGYKLEAVINLGIDEEVANATPTPMPSIVSPTPIASPSAALAPTAQVLILQTPTGFLRVRSDASIAAEEIARVNPGETYPLVSEVSGWYSIKLTDGKVGWISNQYARKQ